MPLKKGDIVRVSGHEQIEDGSIFEVERDVEWCEYFKTWGSVSLVNQYPPLFTHKGGIEIVTEKP